MATDPETNQKLPLNRRDAMRAIAFGAAGVTLSAASGRVLTADRMQAHNTFDAPDRCAPANSKPQPYTTTE